MQPQVMVQILNIHQSISLRPVHHAGIKQNLSLAVAVVTALPSQPGKANKLNNNDTMEILLTYFVF